MIPTTAQPPRGLRRGPAPRQENGFALLVIFLIAAAVAFTMYRELPRAAFESARDKEQLLMDRGNQYKRAIQVYYAVNKRYPAELKDLENTGDKRFLRRRYVDPMTGEDEWRLIHTNGSFLTDSLVQKPPAQNASNGLPGAGQTPGGGPLGANNLNSAPSVTPTANAGNPNDPASVVTSPAALNAAAQRRPSDRGFSAGPVSQQQPGVNPANLNTPGGNPFAANPANFDPADPRTWPPITLPTPNAQAGQPQPQVYGQLPGFNQQPGTMQGGAVSQPFPGQSFPSQPPGQPTPGQPLPGQTFPGQTFPGQAFPAQASQAQGFPGVVQPPPQGIPGQLPGLGGANPQPTSLGNPNPLGQVLPPNDNQNPALVSINPEGQLTPLTNQPVPVPQPLPPNGGPPFNAGSMFNNGQPFNGAQTNSNGGFSPPSAAPFQRPVGGQPNSANLPGNAPSNVALNAINSQLFRPNQAPGAGGPTGSPGIAGVASKFEGPSIKAYRERTKYQEWEFVYEPAANQPGQAVAPGQNPPQNQNGQNQVGPGQNGLGQGLGPTPPGGATNPPSQPNLFSPPTNPFAPQTPPR